MYSRAYKGLRYIKLSNCLKAVSQLVTVTNVLNPCEPGLRVFTLQRGLNQSASIHLLSGVEIYPCQPGL